MKENDALYHVTYWRRLPSIDWHGLIIDAAKSIGGPSYDAHKKGKIFLSEAGGVFFWYARAEEFAESMSDDVWKDRLVPVVLRVAVRHRVLLGSAAIDVIGTSDALSDAWQTERRIPPSRLSVYNGRAFVRLDRFGREDAKLAVYKDRDGYVYFRQENPLLPPECRP